MMIASDTKATIVNAPEGLARSVGPFGLNGKSEAFVNGMIIVSTKVGEIILRLPEGVHIHPGVQLNIKMASDDLSVLLSSGNEPRKPVPRAAASTDEFKRVVPVSYFYQPRAAQNILDGHRTASDAALDGVVRSGAHEDPFTAARALALIPDLSGERNATTLLSLLFVSLARGDAESWLGTSKQVADSVWSIALRESTVEISGMGIWTVRQFPIETRDGTVWGLFAVPELNSGRVSRFIVEFPTINFGLVQIKGFGSEATCEIVVNTSKETTVEAKAAIMTAITAVSAQTGADITVNIVNDAGMLANLGPARRINLGA